MEKEVFILLTRNEELFGGIFGADIFETREDAMKEIESRVECQKRLLGEATEIYIDHHELERLRIRDFMVKDDDILDQVTLEYRNKQTFNKWHWTDRFIIRSKMKLN